MICAWTFVDLSGAVLDVVQTAAIVVAAVWAYWKFVRGRTFARRVEPSVSGELVSAADGSEALKTRITLKNTGASDVPFGFKAIRVFVVPSDDWGVEKVPAWDRVMTVPVLQEHAWIESAEVVSDEVLVPVRPAREEPLAYRLEFVIHDQLRRRWIPRRKKKDGGWSWRHGHQWSTEAIVLRALRPALEPTDERRLSMSERRWERSDKQRNIDERDREKLEQEVEERQRQTDEDDADRVKDELKEK